MLNDDNENVMVGITNFRPDAGALCPDAEH